MALTKNQRVVPYGDKWAIKRMGSAKATEVFDTKAQAMERARQMAKKTGSKVLEHREDGTMTSSSKPQAKKTAKRKIVKKKAVKTAAKKTGGMTKKKVAKKTIKKIAAKPRKKAAKKTVKKASSKPAKTASPVKKKKKGLISRIFGR